MNPTNAQPIRNALHWNNALQKHIPKTQHINFLLDCQREALYEALGELPPVTDPNQLQLCLDS